MEILTFKRLNIAFIMCLLLILINFSGTGERAFSNTEIIHKVKINHPGKTGSDVPEYSLTEVEGIDGIPQQFEMDVESVYCYDSVCKVVLVKIYWNAIGEYNRFEMKTGVQLEKDKGKPFSDEDYQKLHLILQDKNSPFKGISINEIINPSSSEGVDAVSGATSVALNENQTVKGATLSCYTLWHWANGDVISKIRQITGDGCKAMQLRNFLTDGDNSYKVFALQQIIKRVLTDKETINAVLLQVTQNDDELLKLVIEFLELVPADLYFASMEKLFYEGNDIQKVRILNSLIKTNHTASKDYYDHLCTSLSASISYQIVDLMISLMEIKNQSSEKVAIQLIILLDKNILIARRAYWYLSYQKLNPKQQKKVKDFKKKYGNYL